MTKRSPFTRSRITQSLYDNGDICDVPDIACDVVDETIDDVIVILRRDPRFAAISRTEFELMFADVRSGASGSAPDVGDLIPVTNVIALAEEGFPIDDDETEGEQ
jgi:hypothetical protein